MSENTEILQTEQTEGDFGTAKQPSGDGDIFKEIFGQEADRFVGQVGEESINKFQDETPEVSVDNNPKESTDQFQYWQSQADKRTAEVTGLKKELDEIKSKMTSNPTPAVSVEPVSEETVKPVKPLRPSSFDNSEALTDPDSKSAKYVAAREEYLDNMSEYLISQEDKRSEISQKQLEEQKKLTSQQQLLSNLQSQYGYNPTEANDFIEKMSSPDSLSLDNLVKLHKSLTGMGKETIPIPQQNVIDPRMSDMARRQQKLSIPSTITSQPSANKQSSKKIEDQMMDSMISNFKKKNPF